MNYLYEVPGWQIKRLTKKVNPLKDEIYAETKTYQKVLAENV